MNESLQQVIELISHGETLTVEFKSDLKSLLDRDLVSALVARANTEGGELLLGVEDSGQMTGIQASHLNVSGIPALIANKTNPTISVRLQRLRISNVIKKYGGEQSLLALADDKLDGVLGLCREVNGVMCITNEKSELTHQ